MAVESARGCGYRKVGGLYLVGELEGIECDRLPFELNICPCCGEGIKQSRGWTWVNPTRLLDGNHIEETLECTCPYTCPACYPSYSFRDKREAGLLWIGKAYYETPADFVKEGAAMGLSRRISALPNGFKVGVTWIFLAHPEACDVIRRPDDPNSLFDTEPKKTPGIFMAWRPRALERIVKQSDFDAWEAGNHLMEHPEEMGDADLVEILNKDRYAAWEKLQRDVARGIDLVPVPDDDPDHQ